MAADRPPFCRYRPIAWSLNVDHRDAREEVSPMPGPGPESTPSPEGGPPDPDQPQVQGGPSGPRFTWVPGSELDGHELSGPVPPEALPGAKPEGAIPAVLDWQGLLEALGAG